ncbi:type IV pilin protein [Desulfobaculum bizertense]|uniref:Prepilin-type N-terminal cleavage/methylation domain-containing protein n=1 Tax=Desulfobaculum bizertense DSM 18034 TaxID=1121442 RepID=A0A1T4VIF1_9BACT|nr:type II secretion system protein [Desulfobaculum bizertense]UIJ37843.1 type II secretion system GspH family protein [Desulfobaculum bizertense]SKA64361.1 prepilin-type N-terminal cleavage/methylation domain-containing protein [Desulfobaculum bizertense DSM 18034]
MNQNTRKKNGFTMIELIAVIVILGILAAAAVPRFLDARKKAEEAVAKGIVSAWQSTCAMDYAKSVLDGTTFACPTGTIDNSGGSATGKEITGLVVDLGDNEFTIEATGKSGECSVKVTGGKLDSTGITGKYSVPQ